MSNSDEEIRRALHAAADRIEPIGVSDLAVELRARRDGHAVHTTGPTTTGRKAPPRRAWLVAALVMAVVATAVLVERTRHAADAPAALDRVDVGPDPGAGQESGGGVERRDGFDALGPGWHALDTGPVPAATPFSLAWTGTELVVVGAGAAHLYDPAEHRWEALDLPASLEETASAATWTGEELVFVSRNDSFTGPAVSAAWNADSGTWRDLGPVPVAAPVEEALDLVGGGGGLYGSDGNVGLVWTGSHVLDLSHGAVLDPRSGTWTELAMPGSLVPYSALLYSTPVWTGSEVVLAAWATSPGLAWSPDGSSFREVPGLPPDLFGPHDVIPDATATRLGDNVLVLAKVPGGKAEDPTGSEREVPAAALLDPTTGTWTHHEAPAGLAEEPWCWPRSTTVDAVTVVVATRCDGGVPSALLDGTWTTTRVPDDARPCCNGTWVVAGRALVVVDGDTDTHNNPQAPYVRARVWVPPR